MSILVVEAVAVLPHETVMFCLTHSMPRIDNTIKQVRRHGSALQLLAVALLRA